MDRQKLHSQLDEIKEFFDRSTRALDEADSGFIPAPGMYTAAGQIAHAAQVVEWFCDGAFAPGGFDLDFERQDKEVRAVTSIKAAREWMEKACKNAAKTIDAHSEAEWDALLPEGPIMGGHPRLYIFGAIRDHTAHHRGALTVYARLVGKVPPMPYMEM